jgi:DNA-binding transcriptional ArsR family regulator
MRPGWFHGGGSIAAPYWDHDRPQPRGGDPDIATVAGLFADRTRARVLMALSDGRALPASVLAAEAAVTPQAASAQLSRLTGAGWITRAPGQRAVRVTPAGRQALSDRLGLDV